MPLPSPERLKRRIILKDKIKRGKGGLGGDFGTLPRVSVQDFDEAVFMCMYCIYTFCVCILYMAKTLKDHNFSSGAQISMTFGFSEST